MRSVLYDLITGIAIIMGLYVVTNVMKANQSFIFTQSQAETDAEQVYISDDMATKANSYTAIDMYGTIHTLLRNGNNTTDVSRMSVIDYTIIKFKKSPTETITVSYKDPTKNVTTLEEAIKEAVKNPNDIYVCKKTSKYDETAKHKITTYTFEKK